MRERRQQDIWDIRIGQIHASVFGVFRLKDKNGQEITIAIVLPAIWLGNASMLFKTVGQQVTPASMGCLISLWTDIEPIRQIRLDPGFMPFAKKIGLLDVWEKYGWPDLLPKPEMST